MASFFAVGVGTDRTAEEVRAATRAHASWLGMSSEASRHACRDGTVFALGRIFQGRSPAALECDTDSTWRFRLPSCFPIAPIERPLPDGSGTFDAASIEVRVSRDDGGMLAAAPLCTPERLYCARAAGGWVVGNDIRLLLRMTGHGIDPAGVYALFRHGAAVGTITLDRQLRCIPPGHLGRLSPDREDPVIEPIVAVRPAERSGDACEADEVVTQRLDRLVAAIPAGSAVLFSGGVDSALIAARAVELGRRDLILMNCAFGPDDPEAVQAARVAEVLGLHCVRVPFRPAGVLDALERIGTDYAYPFDDTALLATNLLAYEVIRAVGGRGAWWTAGADSAFGQVGYYKKWNRVFAVPAVGRRLLGGMARRLRSYRRPWGDSLLHKTLSVMRRAIVMDQPHTVAMVINGLDGIAYDVPPEVDKRLRTEIRWRMDSLGEDLEGLSLSSLLSLIQFCGGPCAAKVFGPLRRHGVGVLYPFMDPCLLETAFSLSWDEKCTGGEPKDILKRILAGSVPRELVYRTKKGLDTPLGDVLAESRVRQFIQDVVLRPSNPLLQFIRRETLKDVVDRIADGRGASFEAVRFLWIVVMASAWELQVSRALRG